MGETIQLKTKFSQYFSYAFVAGVLLVSAFLSVTDPRELTSSVPILLAIAIAVWVVFAHPRVVVSDGGITVVNVVSTIHVPWPRFAGASTEWNLRIHTDSGTFTAWALPIASGTARRLPRRRSEPSDPGVGAVASNAQGAALIIGERFKALEDAGFLHGGTLQRVEITKRINRVSLGGAVAIALLVAWALV